MLVYLHLECLPQHKISPIHTRLLALTVDVEELPAEVQAALEVHYASEVPRRDPPPPPTQTHTHTHTHTHTSLHSFTAPAQMGDVLQHAFTSRVYDAHAAVDAASDAPKSRL